MDWFSEKALWAHQGYHSLLSAPFSAKNLHIQSPPKEVWFFLWRVVESGSSMAKIQCSWEAATPERDCPWGTWLLNDSRKWLSSSHPLLWSCTYLPSSVSQPRLHWKIICMYLTLPLNPLFSGNQHFHNLRQPSGLIRFSRFSKDHKQLFRLPLLLRQEKNHRQEKLISMCPVCTLGWPLAAGPVPWNSDSAVIIGV